MIIAFEINWNKKYYLYIAWFHNDHEERKISNGFKTLGFDYLSKVAYIWSVSSSLEKWLNVDLRQKNIRWPGTSCIRKKNQSAPVLIIKRVSWNLSHSWIRGNFIFKKKDVSIRNTLNIQKKKNPWVCNDTTKRESKVQNFILQYWNSFTSTSYSESWEITGMW